MKSNHNEVKEEWNVFCNSLWNHTHLYFHMPPACCMYFLALSTVEFCKRKKKIVSRLNKIFTLADVYWACFSSSPTSGRGVFLTPKPVLVVLHGCLLFTAAESESILSVHELHAVSHKRSFTHTRCYICTSQHMTMCCPAKFPVIAVLKVFYVTVFS